MQITGFQLHDVASVRLIAAETRVGRYLAVEITDADGQSLVVNCWPAAGKLIPDVQIDEARAEFPAERPDASLLHATGIEGAKARAAYVRKEPRDFEAEMRAIWRGEGY